MTQEHPNLFGSLLTLPRARGRAHRAKALALATFLLAIPAQGQNAIAVEAIQAAAVTNTEPVAITDYVDLKNAAQAINVLANDTDADNDTLTVVEATARYGAVAFTADGLVAYAVDPAQPRADETTYILTHGRGGRASGKVIVVDR